MKGADERSRLHSYTLPARPIPQDSQLNRLPDSLKPWHLSLLQVGGPPPTTWGVDRPAQNRSLVGFCGGTM